MTTAAKAKAAPKKPVAAKARPAPKKPVAKAKAGAKPAATPAQGEPDTLMIPHDQIAPSPLNPRKTIDEAYVAELAESILAKGQLQNISVRPNSDKRLKARYQIIFGEQRWRAISVLIARGTLPADAPVLARIMPIDDAEHIELAIMENQDRKSVHPLEQAEAYARLAVLRRETMTDDVAVTTLIAERTGQTIRNIQYQLQIASNLSDAAKAAWREGRIRTRKIAIELSRWPHDIQDDMADEIDDVADHAELRRWIEGDAPLASAARFDLEAYVAAGGMIVDTDEEGEKAAPRLAHKGLAARMQREWVLAEIERLTGAESLGLKPVEADYRYYVEDSGKWAKATKKDDRALCGARWHLDARSLEVTLLCPAVARGAAPKAADKADDTEAAGMAPALARRNWLAGAEIRTGVMRELVRNNGDYALAVAIVALLPRSSYSQRLCHITIDRPSGDDGEICRRFDDLRHLALDGLDGLDTSGRIIDAEAATGSLLGLPSATLLAVFADIIANQCGDSAFTAGAGAKGESVAINRNFSPADLAVARQHMHGLCSSEWLKAYTVPQLHAIARDSGAAAALEAEGKPLAANKAYLVSTLPGLIPADYIPPEARFLDAEAAQAAVDAMLAKGGE